MTKISFLLGCLVFVTGCQVTSGHVRSKSVPCSTVQTQADYRGAKPTWNIFGKVTAIEYCAASGQIQHKFRLAGAWGSSQISGSDEVYFHEVSERALREMLTKDKDSGQYAQALEVKHLSNNGRPTLYAIIGKGSDASIFFMMNDGFPAEEPLFWSQVHIGFVRSPPKMPTDSFEARFIREIRAFKNTGGNYPDAYTERSQTSGQSGPAGSKDLSVFGRWKGVSDNFTGHMTSSTANKTGSIVLSLPDMKDRCFGTWKTTSGDFNTQQKPKGIWSVDCESKITASGEFSAEEPWSGLGEGEDSKGRTITFSYKPAL